MARSKKKLVDPQDVPDDRKLLILFPADGAPGAREAFLAWLSHCGEQRFFEGEDESAEQDGRKPVGRSDYTRAFPACGYDAATTAPSGSSWRRRDPCAKPSTQMCRPAGRATCAALPTRVIGSGTRSVLGTRPVSRWRLSHATTATRSRRSAPSS